MALHSDQPGIFKIYNSSFDTFASWALFQRVGLVNQSALFSTALYTHTSLHCFSICILPQHLHRLQISLLLGDTGNRSQVIVHSFLGVWCSLYQENRAGAGSLLHHIPSTGSTQLYHLDPLSWLARKGISCLRS